MCCRVYSRLKITKINVNVYRPKTNESYGSSIAIIHTVTQVIITGSFKRPSGE